MRSSVSLRILSAVFLCVCLAAPANAFAYTNTDVTKHKSAAEAARRKAAEEAKKAAALLAETQRLEARIDALDADLTKLGGEIGSASQRRSRLESEIASLRDDIAAKERDIEQVKQDYGMRVDALSRRVDAVYRAGDWIYIEMLLGSSDLADFLARTEFVTRVIRSDEEIAAGLEGDRVSLETATAELNRALETVNAKRLEVKAEEDNLRSLHSTRDRARDEQASAKAAKSALLAETKANVARLQAAARAEEEESRRIASLLKGGSSHGTGKYAGTMTWPTPGYTRVSSGFGYRIHPILHVKKMHNGIDVSAPSGARLVAAGKGTVISAGARGGYGNCVMIDHGDGLVSVYAHMSRISVRAGQAVASGATIGAVGSTGLSTGPHLHFEVRVNGEPVNPMDYL